MPEIKEPLFKRAALLCKEAIRSPKRRKKEKPIKPKRYVARKAGVATFWLLFLFMFFVVLSTLLDQTFASNQEQKNFVEKKENRAASEEGIQFANNFARNYMSWTVTDEGKAARERVMEKYMAKGLDKYAGLDMEQLDWNSELKRTELRRVEETGDNKAYITLFVETELAKVEKNEETEETEQKEKNSAVADPLTVRKYLVVPVEFNGVTFGVFELPKFTFINEKTTVKAKAIQDGPIATKNADAVRRFLNTFFKSYSEDPPEKLAYMLKDSQAVKGLNQTMNFVEMKKSDIYQGKHPDQYIAFAEVLLEEPQTKAAFTTMHKVKIEKKDDRYIVAAMDHMKSREGEQ